MMSARDYSDLVRLHFEEPVNVGPLCGDSGNMFTGEAGRREHGTEVRFQVRIENARIVEIAFQVYGCPHSVAACSLAAERLAQQPAQALDNFDVEDLAGTLEVPVEKTGRMLLVKDALHQCFRAWENRRLAGN